MTKQRKVKWFIVVAAILLLLIVVVVALFLGKKDAGADYTTENQYIFEPTEETPGTTIYTSDALKAEHCLDSICVEDVTFYYTEEGGRIEYKIVNKSEEVASGFLKLVFDNQFLYITYQQLAAGGEIKTSTFYQNEVKTMEDYHLEHLSEEENKKIIYSK